MREMAANCEDGSSENLSCCELLSRHRAGVMNAYVLHSAVSSHLIRTTVLALSDRTLVIKSADGTLMTLEGHEKAITEIKYSTTEPTLLFSSSLDGKIILWDTRYYGHKVMTFYDDTDELKKPLTCFDFNLDERLICAGTEVVREDSFLLFWDRRNSKNLGGYWNCHTEEITQVHFSPVTISGMASSSVDGLINIFDLSGSSEDDALLSTLNAESPVDKFCWKGDFLSCLTTTEICQIWSVSEAGPSSSFSRKNLSDKFQCEVDYLIDTFISGENYYLATGTNKGDICLWQLKEENIQPVCKLSKGHSNVVRTLSYCSEENIIVSGGEDSFVCLWKPPFHLNKTR